MEDFTLLSEGKELNKKFVINNPMEMILLISEGKELERNFFKKYGLKSREFKDLITESIHKATDDYEHTPLRNALWNMYYVGLAVGNKIHYEGKFQWEIEEDREMEEWARQHPYPIDEDED